jgi:hypothetical protein
MTLQYVVIGRGGNGDRKGGGPVTLCDAHESKAMSIRGGDRCT